MEFAELRLTADQVNKVKTNLGLVDGDFMPHDHMSMDRNPAMFAPSGVVTRALVNTARQFDTTPHAVAFRPKKDHYYEFRHHYEWLTESQPGVPSRRHAQGSRTADSSGQKSD